MNDGSFWVGEEFGPTCCTSTRRAACSPAGSPSGAARAAEPGECHAGPIEPAELARLRVDDPQRRRHPAVPDDRGLDQFPTRQTDPRDLPVQTVTERYTGRTCSYAKDSSDYITGGTNNATNIFVTGDMTHIRRPIHPDRARRLPGAAQHHQPAASEEALSDRPERRQGTPASQETPAGRPARYRRPQGYRRPAARDSRQPIQLPIAVGRIGDAGQRVHAAGGP